MHTKIARNILSTVFLSLVMLTITSYVQAQFGNGEVSPAIKKQAGDKARQVYNEYFLEDNGLLWAKGKTKRKPAPRGDQFEKTYLPKYWLAIYKEIKGNDFSAGKYRTLEGAEKANNEEVSLEVAFEIQAGIYKFIQFEEKGIYDRYSREYQQTLDYSKKEETEWKDNYNAPILTIVLWKYSVGWKLKEAIFGRRWGGSHTWMPYDGTVEGAGFDTFIRPTIEEIRNKMPVEGSRTLEAVRKEEEARLTQKREEEARRILGQLSGKWFIEWNNSLDGAVLNINNRSSFLSSIRYVVEESVSAKPTENGFLLDSRNPVFRGFSIPMSSWTPDTFLVQLQTDGNYKISLWDGVNIKNPEMLEIIESDIDRETTKLSGLTGKWKVRYKDSEGFLSVVKGEGKYVQQAYTLIKQTLTMKVVEDGIAFVGGVVSEDGSTYQLPAKLYSPDTFYFKKDTTSRFGYSIYTWDESTKSNPRKIVIKAVEK